MCNWRCEHARFCVEVFFYVLYMKFCSFVHWNLLNLQATCRHLEPPVTVVVMPETSPGEVEGLMGECLMGKPDLFTHTILAYILYT